jgi:hypothetical protein
MSRSHHIAARGWPRESAGSASTLWAACRVRCAGDFVYRDFNDTTGLEFVVDAATTSCDAGVAVCARRRVRVR